MGIFHADYMRRVIRIIKMLFFDAQSIFLLKTFYGNICNKL